MTVCNALAALCRIYWGPDLSQCEEIVSGTLMDSLAGIGASDPSATRAVLNRLRSYLSVFDDATLLYETLEPAYVRLFVSDRGGISAPLYQSCYESPDALLMGPAAQRMKQRLEAVGLAISPDLNESADHLAIELEYLYFLLKEGAQAGDREAAREAASFAGEEMLPWVEKMGHALEGEHECPFYPLVTRLLARLLQDVAAGSGDIAGDGRAGHG